jgi:thiamine-monophosphate kinase
MSLSEFEVIREFFNKKELALDREEVLLGIGDDAALLSVPSEKVLSISTDMLVESVHFPKDAAPAQIAKRALLVNISDLAAMGAEPLCFTLSLAIAKQSERWLQQFSQGLVEIAQRYNIALVGGDLVAGPTTISIQVHGLNSSENCLRRDRARVGDLIFVTGCLGDGAVALVSLGLKTHLGDSFKINKEEYSINCQNYFNSIYFEPEPRIEFARSCGKYIASAIDISDGLIGDLGHICKASGVGATLFVDEIPYSQSANCCMSKPNLLQAALYGGDDYELCVTVAKTDQEAFMQAAESTNTPVRCIGEINDSDRICCHNNSGEELQLHNESYMHFSGEIQE